MSIEEYGIEAEEIGFLNSVNVSKAALIGLREERDMLRAMLREVPRALFTIDGRKAVDMTALIPLCNRIWELDGTGPRK